MWVRQSPPLERTVPEPRPEARGPVSVLLDLETSAGLRTLARRRGETPEAAACHLVARGLDLELRRLRAQAALARLTPRQRDVARLAAQGRTNRQIAADLYVSTETVKTHMTHVLGKFGLRTKADLRLLLADLGSDSLPEAAPPARLPGAIRLPAVEAGSMRG